jgi:plasmid stabilization system protein ParE
MKCTVKYSTFFLNDLAVVGGYLSQFSETAFTHFKDTLHDRIEKAKDMPMMYAAYPFAPEFRHIVIGKYVVIYRFFENDNRIYMYRLLHGAQNIPDYL